MQIKKYSYEQIEAETCRHFRIARTQLRSPSRDLHHMKPRWVAIYLARRFTKLSFPQLGDRLRRDHTTILWAARRAEQLRADSQEFCDDLTAVVERLNPAATRAPVAEEREAQPPAPPPSQESLVRQAWRASLVNLPRHLSPGAI
jgi:Bacterial dnaA protein helix-turn-helix